MQSKIYVLPLEDNQACRRRAEALGRELGLSRAKEPLDSTGVFLLVKRDRLGLALGREGIHSKQAFWPSLKGLDTSSRAGRSSSQPLLKAVLGRRGRSALPMVLDATAGLGRDAWILAAQGARVWALERSPAVFALLRDCLASAGLQSQATARRILPLHRDALELMQSQRLSNRQRPEVIYLDPLFAQQKRKAAPWKGMQVLQALLAGQELKQELLLQEAMQLASKRVVFKRPLKGRSIEAQGLRPSQQIKSRALRFDIYLT